VIRVERVDVEDSRPDGSLALLTDFHCLEDRAKLWPVICYSAQLSDAALDWLVNGGAITREQRGAWGSSRVGQGGLGRREEREAGIISTKGPRRSSA
jgi:hypothetical protein